MAIGLKVELIQPIDLLSPINRLLEKGGGYHHLCFEVENIEVEITQAAAQGALLVKDLIQRWLSMGEELLSCSIRTL